MPEFYFDTNFPAAENKILCPTKYTERLEFQNVVSEYCGVFRGAILSSEFLVRDYNAINRFI